MSDADICREIVTHNGCYGSNYSKGVSCSGKRYGVNLGRVCPLYGGDFNCDKFGSPKEAAQAWLDAHKEDV